MPGVRQGGPKFIVRTDGASVLMGWPATRQWESWVGVEKHWRHSFGRDIGARVVTPPSSMMEVRFISHHTLSSVTRYNGSSPLVLVRDLLYTGRRSH